MNLKTFIISVFMSPFTLKLVPSINTFGLRSVELKKKKKTLLCMTIPLQIGAVLTFDPGLQLLLHEFFG